MGSTGRWSLFSQVTAVGCCLGLQSPEAQLGRTLKTQVLATPGLVTHKPGPQAGRVQRSGHSHQGAAQGSSEPGRTAPPVRAQRHILLVTRDVKPQVLATPQRFKERGRDHPPRWEEGQGHTIEHVGQERARPWETRQPHAHSPPAANLRYFPHPSHPFHPKQLGCSSTGQTPAKISCLFPGTLHTR